MNLFFGPGKGRAALNVFACEPEWAALAREIGGSSVRVFSATTAAQDPHRVEARPSLIAQMRRADLFVSTGADLEIGCLPVLLREAGNARSQPGRPGYFEASRWVTLIEKPTTLDRSQGDVHAAGNPHIHTDPRNIGRVGAALAVRMAELDQPGAAAYQTSWKEFSTRWDAAIARWQLRAAPLKNLPVAVQHKSFSYQGRDCRAQDRLRRARERARSADRSAGSCERRHRSGRSGRGASTRASGDEGCVGVQPGHLDDPRG